MIDADLIEGMFKDCLLRKEEIQNGQAVIETVKVEGIVHTFVFNKQRLESYSHTVTNIINELPHQFQEGWSFLNLCIDKNGVQWTGEYRICEQLACIAMGLKKAEYCLSRESWPMLPGGMPYVIFN